MTTKQEYTNMTEAFVDRFGLVAVVNTLADIAAKKEDHIRHNWQDEHCAAMWKDAVLPLLRCAARLVVEGH